MTSSRVALASVPESKLNVDLGGLRDLGVARFARSFQGDLAVKGPNRDLGLDHLPALGSLAGLKRSKSCVGETPRAKAKARHQLKLTPRQQRAKVLKMRLQLAYYKVKTNQTEVPVESLAVEKKGRRVTKAAAKSSKSSKTSKTSKASKTSKKSLAELTTSPTRSTDALTDLLAASSPLFKRTNSLPVNVSTATVSASTTRAPKRPRLDGKRLEDVASKNARHHGGRALVAPLSAPANVSKFTLPLPTPSLQHSSFTNQTSPSRFAISRKGYSHTVPLPAIPSLSNGGNISIDSDATLLQQSSLISVTPQRKASAPTLSTPQSMGAAQCLLQLAHR